jgi:hypothetical protein
MSKGKYGMAFVALENNPVSNKTLTDVKTTRSDAFFRFTVAVRVDVLSRPANSEQWYLRPRIMCQRRDKHTEAT